MAGVVLTCQALGVSRASFYRRRQPSTVTYKTRPKPRRSLSQTERQIVLDVLSSERFMDKVPTEVHTTLLDEGIYLCSIRTMYRILAQEDKARKRRNQLRHNHQKPELLITQPNRFWSWDIIKLTGSNKWTNFYLYLILDDFSHYVVGWRIANRESGSLIGQLIQETCRKQKILRNQLTLRSDRDSTTYKSVKLLLFNSGVHKTHNYSPTLNSHSSNQLKTLKNQPMLPGHLDCVEDAQAFCQKFFAWYNREYYHSDNSLLTPEVMHYGLGRQIVQQQQRRALSSAYQIHPERFVHRPPQLLERTMSIDRRLQRYASAL